MELQFHKETCTYLNRVLREVQNLEQTQEIKVPEGMPEIGRVLASWGQMVLRSKEWRSGSIRLSGGIMVWVLYEPEDGSQLRSLESWIPFQMKWDIPEGKNDGDIRVRCMLRFVDARSVSPRKIMVRCGVSALAEAMVPDMAATYSAQQEPEEVCLLKTLYPVRLPREAGEKQFSLEEELTLGEGDAMPETLICYTLQPEITEQKILGDKVVFRGNGNLHVLYLSEDGQLHSRDFDLPFSQLAELTSTPGADARAQVDMGVTNLEGELGSDGMLLVKCGLLGQFLVDDRQLLELVEDAYCLGRQAELQTQMLELPAVLETRQENVYGEQTIPQDAQRVVDCYFLPDHPRMHRGTEEIELEIPGQFQVLYYGEDGLLQSAGARWEGHWSMKADQDCRVDVSLRPLGRPQAAIGGGGIGLESQVELLLSTSASQGQRMVTGLELGEEQQFDPMRPSLILRRAGEDRLWDIAKLSGSTVDAIRQANDLTEEPASDRILLIPIR